MKSNWYHRRDVRFLVVVAILLGGYIGWGYVMAPVRISDELKVAMDEAVAELDDRMREKAIEFATQRAEREARERGETDPVVITERDIRAAMPSARQWVQPHVNIVVVTKFPAERFHLDKFQDVGNVQNMERNNTLVYSVLPKDVWRLARYYWIERIDLAPSRDG